MVFSSGFFVAMVTDYVKVITKIYLAIIPFSNDTILLSLSDTEWFYNATKVFGLPKIQCEQLRTRLRGYGPRSDEKTRKTLKGKVVIFAVQSLVLYQYPVDLLAYLELY